MGNKYEVQRNGVSKFEKLHFSGESGCPRISSWKPYTYLKAVYSQPYLPFGTQTWRAGKSAI